MAPQRRVEVRLHDVPIEVDHADRLRREVVVDHAAGGDGDQVTGAHAEVAEVPTVRSSACIRRQ
jgi:hypothetical protein